MITSQKELSNSENARKTKKVAKKLSRRLSELWLLTFDIAQGRAGRKIVVVIEVCRVYVQNTSLKS